MPALNFFRIQKGLNLTPQSGTPTSPSNGDIYYNSGTNTFQFYQNGSFVGFASTTGFLKADGSVPLTASWAAGAFTITANSVQLGSAANTITGLATIVNTGTLTLPTATDTLVGRATTDTLTNKTISGASNTLSSIADGSLSTSYLKADGTRALTGNWAAGAFSATHNSVVVGSAANTISGLSTIVNTGTLTLPTATDTLVARTTTDTLTNKTISGSSNTLSNISDASLSVSYIKADGTRAFTGIQTLANAGVNFASESTLAIARDSAASVQVTSTTTTQTRFFVGNTGTNGGSNLILYPNAGTGNSWITTSRVGASSDWNFGQKGSDSKWYLSYDLGTVFGGTNALIVDTTSAVSIQGVATNSVAAAGKYGEVIGSTQITLQNAPTSTQYGDITSITLTPGSWLLSANAEGVLNTGVALLEMTMGIGTTTGNSSAGAISGVTLHTCLPATSNYNSPVTIANHPVQITTNTTYYLKMEATYTSGTPQFRGRIQGVRVN